MTVKSDESLRQDKPELTFETFLAAFDCIPMMLSIFTAYEKSHVSANNQGEEDSDTPPSIPNPTHLSLDKLDAAINSAINYIPLQKSLGSADYNLSIMHVYPESLNTAQPYEHGPKSYHPLLRTTRLHQATSTITLRTVVLGRIYYKDYPTSWICVWELRGNLFALRSDIVSAEELEFKEMDDGDVGEPSMEKSPAVFLPEFEKWSSKAVYLGKTALLGEKEVLGGLGTKGGYRVLQVTRWESDLVSNEQAI
jgi:hypothetical protein